MLIKSVELKNVKSYRHDTIQFYEGINGISGENGHGKTTILEAIGYVLFDSLPYKEADFLRRGEKSGYASVEVLVNGASYTLTRKLGAAAEYSMRGDMEVKGKKDVLAWLIHNAFPGLSYEELPRIFENAVGVPQGTFTAAFIETPAKRKKTFDEILKVEEYRNAYENLRSTMTVIDEGVRSIENDIEKLKIRTESYEKKKEELDVLMIDIQNLRNQLKDCVERLNVAKNKRDKLKSQKNTIDGLDSEIKQISIKLEGLKKQFGRSKEEQKNSEGAKKIVSELSGEKEKYDESKNKLDRLEETRKERDAVKEKLNAISNELAMLNEKRTRLDSLKAEVEKNKAEKNSLAPRVKEQLELEEKLEFKKEERAITTKEINDIKSKMGMAGTENLCPLIKGVRCNSVSDFTSYFREQFVTAENKLKQAENSVRELSMKLAALDDARSKTSALDSLVKRALAESEKLIKEVQKIPEKENAYNELADILGKYANLESELKEVKEKIRDLEPLYKKYLQNLSVASRLEEFGEECNQLEKAIANEGGKLKDLENKYRDACSGFSIEMLLIAEHTYEDLSAKVSGYEVKINEKDGQLKGLNKEILDMEKYLKKIIEHENKLENEKQFGNFAKFIRETLRDSAQHIVLELIGEISEEANNLYCAIMDDFSQELRWSEDYGIIVKESGEEKNFHQLSGGEKMGAALALRLALLKMLSNSDFVFLDEPTANMDEIRRENLSEQIMNIKGFKQIFVISHDDTFNEKYGHVVKIEKINGESRAI